MSKAPPAKAIQPQRVEASFRRNGRPSREVAPSQPARDLLALQRVAGNWAVNYLSRPIAAPVAAAENGSGSTAEDALPGSALVDPHTRRPVEEQLGADLSDVRVHTGTAAEDRAGAKNAAAYASGRDIYLPRGLDATSDIGRRVLAHELTHVVQQTRGEAGGAPASEAALEREANAVSGMAGAQASSDVGAATPGCAQKLTEAELEEERRRLSVGLRTVPPEEEQQLRAKWGLRLPSVSKEAAEPRTDPSYLDRHIQAVGYSIWLFGYVLYCEGLELPVFVPESLVDLALKKASSTSTVIYADYDSARATIPYGPLREGQAVPYAYYRTAGGALPLIVPTVFSPATTPRTVELMRGAVTAYAKYVQQELEVVAKSIVTGMVLRGLIRVAPSIGTRLGSRDWGKVPPKVAPSIKGKTPKTGPPSGGQTSGTTASSEGQTSATAPSSKGPTSGTAASSERHAFETAPSSKGQTFETKPQSKTSPQSKTAPPGKGKISATAAVDPKVSRSGKGMYAVKDEFTGEDLGYATVDRDGYVELAIYTNAAVSPIRGGQVFNKLLPTITKDGHSITGVRGLWGGKDPLGNLTSLNKSILKGNEPEAAALETFTGKMAQRAGFPRVRIDYPNSPRNPDGTFQRVEAWFDR